jgi:hypothetical protein
MDWALLAFGPVYADYAEAADFTAAFQLIFYISAQSVSSAKSAYGKSEIKQKQRSDK